MRNAENSVAGLPNYTHYIFIMKNPITKIVREIVENNNHNIHRIYNDKRKNGYRIKVLIGYNPRNENNHNLSQTGAIINQTLEATKLSKGYYFESVVVDHPSDREFLIRPSIAVYISKRITKK